MSNLKRGVLLLVGSLMVASFVRQKIQTNDVLVNKVMVQKTEKMKIEIWSDVMCPFCYIGKRRFEKALENTGLKNKVEVEWKSFQLDPTTITDPNLNVIQNLADKKGWSLEYAEQMTDHVVAMAEGEGLYYDFSKAVVANSFNAHRLLQYSKTLGKGSEFEEVLFKSYFVDGKNTDDKATLIDLGVSIGLKESEVKSICEDTTQFAYDVKQDIEEARQLGINAVPNFVFNRKYAISGAQEVENFEKALLKAYNDWSEQEQ